MAVGRSQLQTWLTEYLAQLLGMPVAEVDPTFSFELYGLDSTAAVGLTGDLSELLGQDLEPTLAYDHPTIEALVDHLTTQGLLEADA